MADKNGMCILLNLILKCHTWLKWPWNQINWPLMTLDNLENKFQWHNRNPWPRKWYKRCVTLITSTYKWSLYFEITWDGGHLGNDVIKKKAKVVGFQKWSKCVVRTLYKWKISRMGLENFFPLKLDWAPVWCSHKQI